MDNSKPKVSIITITYGHENYIEDTFNGIFMQQYNGPIELIIANDNSPDNTDKVIKNYLANHTIPENFEVKYTCHPENKGMMPNFIWALEQATGKYIALCEGDDYWTDPLKLQKQVDFLEENPEFGSCFHQYKIYFDTDKKFSDEIQPKLLEIDPHYNGAVLNSESYFKGWYTQILTSLFRKEILNNHKIEDFEFYRDNHLTYFLLRDNKSICFNWVAAVYRKHSAGIYSGISFKQNYVTHYYIYEELLLNTKDKRFYYLCDEMLNILIRKLQFLELIDLYKKMKVYSLKRKLLFSYDFRQKKIVFTKLPLKEKKFILTEYFKNYYVKHLHPHR